MKRARLIIMIVLLANLFLLTTNFVHAQPVLTPNYGTAFPDGNEGEWNTSTPPFAPIFVNPDWVAYTCAVPPCTNANATGDLYMRYDTTGNHKPNQGDMMVLWRARSGFTYVPDSPSCTTGTCENWFKLITPPFVPGDFVDDSNQYLSNPWPRVGASGDAWRQLTDGRGFENTLIEWDCNKFRQMNMQAALSGGQISTTGIFDLTPQCTTINSQHGPTAIAGVPVVDTLTISSALPTKATGLVTWYYCDDRVIQPPSTSFPNGCLPTDPRFHSTAIGTTIVHLNTPPPSVRVAWNIGRDSVIPLLGPELSPLNTFTPVSTVTVTSPPLTPALTGTYCFYAFYQPDTAAQTAGYSAMAHTNNSSQCFLISTPTAVTLSSLTAQAGPADLNLPMILGLFVGALVITGAGMVGLAKIFRMF